MTRKELISLINKNQKQIDKRFDTAYRNKYADSSVFESYREKIETLTGKPQSGRYVKNTGLWKMKKSRLELIAVQQKNFLKSKYTTLTGRKEIANKRFKSLQETYTELTKKGFNVLNKILGNIDTSLQRLIETKNFKTTDIIELIDDNGIESYTDFVKTFDFMSKNFDTNKLSKGELKRIFDVLVEMIEHRIDFDDIERELKGIKLSDRGVVSLNDILQKFTN